MFGIVVLQIDDTLYLGNEKFRDQEDEELRKAQFLAKPLEKLTPHNPLSFNGGTIILDGNDFLLIAKDQGNQIMLVDIKSPSYRDNYRAQRARGAYIANLCQPEASFDLSVAAQHQDPLEEDMKLLNKRLK